MTAHRCCPACGAELPAHGGTFCGCVGSFAVDHVDPAHIRPYMDLPAVGQSEYGTEPPAGNGVPEAGYVTTHLAGSGAADAGPSAPDLELFAQDHTAETSEPPAPAPPVPSGRRRGSHAAPRPVGQGRRRKGTIALAAAGVVALGTGLLTTQSLTDDRSLSSEDRAGPETPSGPPTDEPSQDVRKEREKKPSPSPSRTASATPSADRVGSQSNTAPVPDNSATPDAGRDRPTSSPPKEKPQPGGGTLRQGDKGPEVAELQRRLKKTGIIQPNEKVDGVYSVRLQMAVFQYQATRVVFGDLPGEYGPNTRKSLESKT